MKASASAVLLAFFFVGAASASVAREGPRPRRALEEDAGALDADLSMAEMGWWSPPPPHPPMVDPKACPAPGGPVTGWGGPPPAHPESEWGSHPPSHPQSPWGRRTQWKSKSKQSKKSGPKPDGTKDETCAPPVGTPCNGHSMYKIGGVGIDSDGGPAEATWSQLAELAGKDDVVAFPGSLSGESELGTLEGCMLAPISSMEEFENLNYELRRIVVGLLLKVDGNTDRLEDFLASTYFALGVVKKATDVNKDNGGKGSRAGWLNLDGTPADVCDAAVWGEGQPNNISDFPENRLFLLNGLLDDAPDIPEPVFGLYKCCMPTLTFSACGATA